MKRLLRIVWRTAKWTFFVVLLSVLLLAAVLVFRRLPVPAALVDALKAAGYAVAKIDTPPPGKVILLVEKK